MLRDAAPNAMSAALSISVIVICRNPGTRLRAALASVWAQPNIQPELIVMGGASTDGMPEGLGARRERIATLVSEPDGGIYEAMNQSVAASRSDWVISLGANDRLAGDRVRSEALNGMKNTDAGVAAGETADDGRIDELCSRVNPLTRNVIHHQSAFYHRMLFEENGASIPRSP
jgi:glycosyltransferase involved in cell wall biosynthesis